MLRPQRTTPAKGGTPPFNTPPAYTVMGGGVRENSHFFTRKIRNAALETVSPLRMKLSVLRRVPAPVVGVNDA